jgi:hypothetical protein
VGSATECCRSCWQVGHLYTAVRRPRPTVTLTMSPRTVPHSAHNECRRSSWDTLRSIDLSLHSGNRRAMQLAQRFDGRCPIPEAEAMTRLVQLWGSAQGPRHVVSGTEVPRRILRLGGVDFARGRAVDQSSFSASLTRRGVGRERAGRYRERLAVVERREPPRRARYVGECVFQAVVVAIAIRCGPQTATRD